MCYGLEGQDYKVISGAGTDNPTVEAFSGDEQKWGIWHCWIGELPYNQWPSNWNDENTLEVYRKGNEEGKVSPILGFIFDPEPIKTEVGQIDAIMSEVLPILQTGSAPDLTSILPNQGQDRKPVSRRCLQRLKGSLPMEKSQRKVGCNNYIRELHPGYLQRLIRMLFFYDLWGITGKNSCSLFTIKVKE